jgi:DNA-binding transcriptional MerR regulator
MSSFKETKAITIGAVSEITGLSERQIRYYEDKELISPSRTSGGTRKYSFNDIEKIVEVSKKIKKGIPTFKIKQETTDRITEKSQNIKERMLMGQINAAFKRNV